MKTLLIFFFLIIANLSLLAQSKYYTKSRKAIKNYEKAIESFEKYNYRATKEYLDLALRADENFIEALLLYAQYHSEQRNPSEAIKIYEKIAGIDPDYFPLVWLYVANTHLNEGKYEQAKREYEKFLTFEKESKKFAKSLINRIEQCKFAINAMKHPVAFKPVNLGKNINSELNEYAPALTADEGMLLFTRLVPTPRNSPNRETYNEDFYMSKSDKSDWLPALNIGKPLNTVFNEGAPSMSADGLTMAYISCVCRDGIQKCCDVFLSARNGDIWTSSVDIGNPVNTPAWESQPSLSADGRILYFVSNRKGGRGGKDIWVSYLNDDGQWSSPENLGDSINTKYDEISPFIHPDGKTLYFGSNGHIGMGQHDLFLSRIDSAGRWQKPENLGYPINTHKNEGSLILNARGNLAMFASAREGGLGGLDLYSFNVDSAIRPNPVNYVKGVIYDSISKKRLRAEFELYNLRTGKRVFKSHSDMKTGRFLVCIPIGEEYAFNVDKEGYLFFSRHFSLIDYKDDKPYELDIPLIPVRVGERVILRNVFFDTDKYILKPKSHTELNKLLIFLRKYPKVKIELSGHTDNQGTEKHNQELSENRAKAVYDYLLEKGINPKRLTYVGYGFSQPIDTNDTSEGRANNRRTEFKVLEM